MKDSTVRNCIVCLLLLAATIICAVNLALSERHLAAVREEADGLRGALAAVREKSEESQSEVRALRLSLQGLERDLAACQARAEKHPGPEPAPPGPAGSPPRARPDLGKLSRAAPAAPPCAPRPCPIPCRCRCRRHR